MKCPNCNTQLKDDARFCTSCGMKLNEASEAAAESSGTKQDVKSDTNESQELVNDNSGSDQLTDEAEPNQQTEPPKETGTAPEAEASENAEAGSETKASNAEAASETEPSQDQANAQEGLQPMEQGFSQGFQSGADMQPGFTMAEKQPGDAPAKKKGLGLKIGIGAAVAGIVAIAAFGATFIGRKDPKTVVIDAFKSVYTSEKESPIEEIFGFNQLAQTMKKENYEAGFSIMLENIDDNYLGEFSGSGIEISSKNDIKSKKSSASMKVIYNDMDLVGMDIYMDTSDIMLAIPDFSEKVFTFNYADDLQGQIEDSPYLGKALLESGMDASVFTDYMDYVNSFYGDNDGNRPFDFAALWERYKTGSKAIDDLKAAMTVEKADKGNYEVDGKSVKCQGYDVTIPKDAVVDFLDTSSQFFLDDETLKKDILEYMTQVLTMSEKAYGMDFMDQSPEDLLDEQWDDMESGLDEFLNALDECLGDIEMRIYVDKKGRLISIDASTNVINDDDEEAQISLKAEFNGGTYLTQNMDFTFTVVDPDDDESILTLKREGTYDDKELTCNLTIGMEDYWTDISFDYAGTYTLASGDYEIHITGSDEGSEVFEVVATGVVEDLVKGKSFRAVADSISIVVDGREAVELSGHYLLKAMEGEVTAPEGEQMDILAATEADWQLVIMEIYTNFSSLLYQLQ